MNSPAIFPARSHARAGAPYLRLAALLAASALSGCATLPSSGPTASQVVKAAQDPAGMNLQIVNIDAPLVDRMEKDVSAPQAGLAVLARSGDVDAVGPGDILQIAVFEVGVSLFGSATGGTAGADFTPSAKDSGISNVVVDRDGAITLPYVGRLQVGGLAPSTIQKLIERGLGAFSQSPQVLVSVRENVSNTVVVMGDVQKPGRQSLTLARSRLLDVIAAAGGTGQPAQNMLVRFTRDGRSIEESLETIVSGSPQDLVLVPGDRIDLIRSPRTFTVFGATNRVSQIAFESRSVSLAEAVARAGGPSDAAADPSAVFLFRYAAPADSVPAVAADGGTVPAAAGVAPAAPGQPVLPVIYRLNMLKPASYFLAQRFAMRDKDVIYISNSASNQPTKFVQIINLLFSPVFAVRSATR